MAEYGKRNRNENRYLELFYGVHIPKTIYVRGMVDEWRKVDYVYEHYVH